MLVLSIREDLLKRLRSFHNQCLLTMRRVTMAHTIRCRIRTTCMLFDRLRILPIDDYYYHRLLRWTSHIAQMEISHTPRKIIRDGWKILGCRLFRMEQDDSRSPKLGGCFHAWTEQRNRRAHAYGKGRTCSSSHSNKRIVDNIKEPADAPKEMMARYL